MDSGIPSASFVFESVVFGFFLRISVMFASLWRRITLLRSGVESEFTVFTVFGEHDEHF